MQAFRLALSFLTILPGGLKEEAGPSTFGKSLVYFPVVGLIIGLILAGVYGLASIRLDAQVSSALIIVALIALTRALHLDGLGDTFDGLFGGRDREHALTIMKDSRVGSFGVVAITGALILKFALLSSLPAALAVPALIVFPVLSRWAAAYALATQPYARGEGGLGGLFIGNASKQAFVVATVPALVVSGIALHAVSVAAILAVGLTTLALTRFTRRKIGGITGDTTGALIEITEIVVLLVALT